MLDRKVAERAFTDYTSEYDLDNTMIRLKAEHTIKVAQIAERIAVSIGMKDDEIDFAWFLGLLHDIGRFEQVRRYGTFSDAKSIDHAELGADLLFRDGLLDNFIKGCEASELSRWISGRWREIAERAIRLHNKLALPEGLDDTMRTYCELLRDADKADIFRVLSEVPYEDRSAGFPKIEDRDGARDEIMECVLAHKCVPRVSERTKFESLLSQCCMAFELVYPKTRDIVYEQGYLDRLLSSYDETGGIKAKQMQIVRREIVKSWG